MNVLDLWDVFLLKFPDVLTIYLVIGFFVSVMTLYALEENNVTGEQILSYANFEIRNLFMNHPMLYKAIVIICFLVIIFIWPYVLYRMSNNNNTGNGYA